jgi:DNA-binding LytR/AlgR family response regulator
MYDLLLKCGLKCEKMNFLAFRSGEEFIEKMQTDIAYDLLILDVKMKEVNGDEVAKRFREFFPHATLVFYSLYPPTDVSFKSKPYGYLLKNYGETRMLEELRAVVREMERNSNKTFISVRLGNNIVRLRPNDIMYICKESRRETHVYGVLKNRNKDKKKKKNMNGELWCFISDEKVEQLYDNLRKFGFSYISYNHIVNINYVNRLIDREGVTREKDVQFYDGSILSVTRSYLKNFKSEFVRNAANRIMLGE